jgi:hypothetical protein
MTKLSMAMPLNPERRRFANVHALVAHASIAGIESARTRNDPSAPIYAYAITDLERVDPPMSDEEAAMYWERIEMHAAEQRAKYWHAVSPDAESASTREITVTWASDFSEQDVEWHVWPLRREGGQHVGSSYGVLALHLPTGIAVKSTDERSQYANRQAAVAQLRKLVGPTLTPNDLIDDTTRCAVCGWSLVEYAPDGCVRGNCSLRPRPERLYAPRRAVEEMP